MSDQQLDEQVIEREETDEETTEPKKYKVVFLNDDYTTMEFVVRVLQQIYRKSSAEATEIMLKIHNRGRGVAGIYSREIAETKVRQTISLAREEGHPLQVTIEPE